MINKVLEQYKKSKQASYEALQARCNELEFSNRRLKQECEWFKKDAGVWAYKAGLAMVSASRCKQALDEIEEYCRQNKHSGWVDIEGILDIISKAKGEENAG